jgi:hypothetical protein
LNSNGSGTPGNSGGTIGGNEGCSAVIDDWNSGSFDQARNRLLLWGGGHQGYYGNEIYAIDLDTLTTTRLTDPSYDLDGAGSQGDVCGESHENGTQPASRHTYDGLLYVPPRPDVTTHPANPYGMLVVTGEGDECGTGVGSNNASIWTFNFSNAAGTAGSWAWVNSETTAGGGPGPVLGTMHIDELDPQMD